MNRITQRLLAAAALAATLAVAAVPAVQALPAEEGTLLAAPAGLWMQLTDWIGSLFAASGTESGAGPEMDPDGPPQADPNGLDADPGLDPNSTESDAGPEMDPNG